MSAFTPPVVRRDGQRFGKPTHWYEDAVGLRIPGVTTIIDHGVPKPALVGWAANVTAEYAVNNWRDLNKLAVADRLKELKGARYAEKDAAARRGTEVHELGQALVHGERVDVPDELAGHVDAYVKFLDEWEPVPVASEATVINLAVGYAGTLDLIADMDGARWLLDLKTTRSGVYGETALQLAAYRYAESLNDGPMPAVDRCGVVWVRADGYDVVPVAADDTAFLHFRYAARVANWCDELAANAIGTPLGPPKPSAPQAEVLL